MQVKIEELINGLKITETIGSNVVVRYVSSYGFPFIRSTNEEGKTYQVVDSVGEIYNLPAVPSEFLLVNINGQSYTPSTGDELIEDSFHLKPFRKDDLEDKVISIGNVTATSSIAKLSLNISGVNFVFINGNLREKYVPDEFNFIPVTTGIKVLIIYAKDDSQIFHLAEGIEALEAVEPEYTGLLVSRIIVSSDGNEVEIFGNPGDVWVKTEDGAIWSPRLTEAEQGVSSALTTLSGVLDELIYIEQYKANKDASEMSAENIISWQEALGVGDIDLSPYALDADLDAEIVNRAIADGILDGKITTEKNRNDAQDLSIANLSLNQIEITTTTSITSNTLGTVTGKEQHMRSVLVKNGVNAINITLETSSNAKFEAIYYKKGSANITFVAGAGATLVKVANDGILNGAVDSNALVYRDGNTFYLYISNY
ncbi:MAG: hypothetical protein LC112_11040 [Flavobacteriales bacterium]|nr:hypothetical protein [Flavobacteriales bacterium]